MNITFIFFKGFQTQSKLVSMIENKNNTADLNSGFFFFRPVPNLFNIAEKERRDGFMPLLKTLVKSET